MIVIRPIENADFEALKEIAVQSGVGFTSLPVNDDLLMQKIALSEASFASSVSAPAGESYLFVAEDTVTGEVVGTAGIEAAVGLKDAFYHYRLGSVVHSSPELGVHKTVGTLSLCNDYTGAAELCTLFLKPTHREGLNGRLLSKSRFLFIASNLERFGQTIIAEMRGVSDATGVSPFWVWLQDHFFDLDFPTADYLTGIGKKQFIAELMPKYPIYVNLLSEPAQQVIGQVHKDTAPALALLEQEGFVYNQYVDIFDAGPTVECQTSKIESVQNSIVCQVVCGQVPSQAAQFLVAPINAKDFRAGCLRGGLHDDELIISADDAQQLRLNPGDSIRCIALP
ncbi:arginine N-succinyltransferase [Echinimonas agarilytica]|uniref:Arginine N-succinyltransferase n=1 Tax=Echinimonas agarilytica TaxID=1215918 RepID=A0AA41W3Y8_9GAMM|nr:arginine N-succinyltransferase [Echinimonas agarilytica]MCM2678379.1 arginine N-succinyltransferase [Echinimonas agarilytica]